MQRKRLSFREFKKYYIDHPDGYFSVYSAFADDMNGEDLKIVNLDMICEWRLPDGKVQFLSVAFDTEEELKQIVAYLKFTAEMLNKVILERINSLQLT